MPFPKDVLAALKDKKLSEKATGVVDGLKLSEQGTAILKGVLLVMESFKDGLPKDSDLVKAVADATGSTIPALAIADVLKSIEADKLLEAIKGLPEATLTALKTGIGEPGETDPLAALKGLPDGVRGTVETAFKALAEKTTLAEREQKETLGKLVKAQTLRVLEGEVVKCKAFKSLPVDADKIAPIMVKLQTDDPEGYKELHALLSAADSTLAKSKIFSEAGSGGSSSGDESELEKKAAEYRAADKDLSKAGAMTKAMKAHPELYKAWKKERGE